MRDSDILSLKLPVPTMIIFLLIFSALSSFAISSAGNTISPDQPSISNGQTIVSANGRFELGFFSLGSPRKQYLGIWFSRITPQTVVWVANRDKPLNDTTGVLKLGRKGDLLLVNRSGEVIFWSTGATDASKPVAVLEDTGNLVVRDNNSGTEGPILWESFDHPSNTWLPGMKLGWDPKTGYNRNLTSWRSIDDPSPGDYTFRVELQGFFSHGAIWRGTSLAVRGGIWNGLYFTDRNGNTWNRNQNSLYFLEFNLINNQNDGTYFTYTVKKSVISRIVMDQMSGLVLDLVWQEDTRTWDNYWKYPESECLRYNLCGANGLCNSDVPTCKCLPGFVPKLADDLNIRNGDDRCVRRTALDCGKGSDGFVEVKGVRLPDMTNASVDMSKSMEQCRMVCLNDCSCTAYALADIKAGIGCIRWVGRLVDVQDFTTGGGELYLRLAASELDNSHKKRKLATIIAPTLAGAVLLLFLAAFCLLKRKRKHGTFKFIRLDEWRGEEVQLPIFSFETIAAATCNFCNENKLGEGGFGPVYKGKLDDGQEIAVKRLSKDSLQGPDEFMNEITLIAKLQHRNLVRLLGCCIQRDERMLIYEYMPNRSLNAFIFDKEKCAMLDWKMRIDIILGIARGVLYLHQDSRLRIVHRDLKAGNILLDQGMNPKISDFGTARIFRADQVKDKTRTVVGTYGYMSPEYVINGIFSMKSDVFSFGVLVIEIMSGMKNRVVQNSDPPLTLLGYAWKLWNEGNISELLDKRMGLSCANSEVLRCIQIGLLCVQERSEDRPQMSSVGIMLGSDSTLLPRPKKPGFYTAISSNESDSSNSRLKSPSVGDVSLTVLEGR